MTLKEFKVQRALGVLDCKFDKPMKVLLFVEGKKDGERDVGLTTKIIGVRSGNNGKVLMDHLGFNGKIITYFQKAKYADRLLNMIEKQL